MILDPARNVCRLLGCAERITAVRVRGDEIVQIFGNEPAEPGGRTAAVRNYMAYRGGIYASAVTMNDAICS